MKVLDRHEREIAGAWLVAPIAILMLALVVMIASGATAGLAPMIRGEPDQAAAYASTFRLPILLFALSWPVHVVGLALLGRLLWKAGSEQIAVASFTLLFMVGAAAFSYYSFRASVELWALQETARTGVTPSFYEPLREWLSQTFRIGYRAHFVAMAGMGWGILRSHILPLSLVRWVIGWNILWLGGGLLGVGAPAVPLLMPAVVGVALLWRPTKETPREMSVDRPAAAQMRDSPG